MVPLILSLNWTWHENIVAFDPTPFLSMIEMRTFHLSTGVMLRFPVLLL